MWFPLALMAMLMLVVRRGTEKSLTGKVDAMSMAWLQQLVALPFVALAMLVPMATFFSLAELSMQFYLVVLLYGAIGAVDSILYFKAISLGDISVMSSVLSLVIVSNMLGVYLFLGQEPSVLGMVASACVLIGAWFASRRLPSTNTADTASHKLALILVLALVALRGLHSPLEVTAMRETDPFFFNLASSLVTIPFLLLAMYLWGRRRGVPVFSRKLASGIRLHWIGFAVIGLTFAINLTCTYLGKSVADNAAYVTTIKAANVLPMMVLGAFLFKEKVRKRQWFGMGIILIGLVVFSQA